MEQQAKVVKRVTVNGILVNISLAVAKIVFGYLAASQTMIADGIHSFSDLLTDAILLIGVKFWSAPPDKEHPYGHARFETLVTAIIGLFLAFVAVMITKEALTSLSLGEQPVSKINYISIIVLALAIVAKELLYQYTTRAAQKIHSSALKANAWHHRSDAISSIPALLAVAIHLWQPTWYYIDAVGAIVVGAMLLVVAGRITCTAFSELLDRCPEGIQELCTLAEEIPGVVNAHALRARKLGAELIVDLHVEVDPEMSVRAGHHISSEVERHLMASHKQVAEVIVHIEPAGEAD